MTKRCSSWMMVTVLAGLSAHASAGPAAQPFTLGKYIPQDCWMFVHGVHNPAHDFIDAHWARVFEEVKKSGIDVELKKLIAAQVPQEDRAGFEHGWDNAIKLLNGVRWGDLIAKEVAFAERLGNITPDLIFLCRGANDTAAANVQGLKAILDALASLSEGVSVTEDTQHGVKVWTLAAKGFPMSLHLFNQGDLIGIVVGPQALNDVLTLVAGEKGVEPVVESPRFKKALAELPLPENSVAFFDLQLLMRNLDQMFGAIFTKVSEEKKEPAEDALRIKGLLVKLLTQFDFFDYAITADRTEGLRSIAVSRVHLRADALDKPLCRMMTVGKPFERFDQYIPREATGFSVSSFLDLRQLYVTILDFIRESVPEGASVLTQWADLQKRMDFDIEADLFSWWSGEMVSVALPSAVKGPLASEDSVLLIRVKDAKLAAAKVNAGIDRLAAFLREHEQNLMLADAADVQGEGFRSITHPILAMQGVKFLVGVADEHLIIGNTAAGINACLATAAGKAPSIVQNERFKAEGLLPPGPVCGASFTDLSKLGQELGTAFFMLGMFGQMIPPDPETQPIKACISLLGRLSPAINKIDFLSSSATVCTFDGQTWTIHEVLNYKPAPPPTTAPAETGSPPAAAKPTAP
jgi:hypothetical protein